MSVNTTDSRCHSWLPAHGSRFDMARPADREVDADEDDLWDLGVNANDDISLVLLDLPGDFVASIQSLADRVNSLWGPEPDNWLARFSGDPIGVLSHLSQHGLEDGARETIQMAEDCFPAGSRVNVSLKDDPESDDVWVVVHTDINADWEKAYGLFDSFVDKWINSASTTTQKCLRLTYHAR